MTVDMASLERGGKSLEISCLVKHSGRDGSGKQFIVRFIHQIWRRRGLLDIESRGSNRNFGNIKMAVPSCENITFLQIMLMRMSTISMCFLIINILHVMEMS